MKYKVSDLKEFYFVTVNASYTYHSIWVMIPKINQVACIVNENLQGLYPQENFSRGKTTLDRLKNRYWSCPIKVEAISLEDIKTLCPSVINSIIETDHETSVRKLFNSNQINSKFFKYHLEWERSQRFYTTDNLKCNCHICDKELEMAPIHSFHFLYIPHQKYIWLCLKCRKKVFKGKISPYLPNLKRNFYNEQIVSKNSPLNFRPKL